MRPLVSIIMPAFNAELYIAASVQSVIDQSYQNWELLIIDDGSTDQTAEKVNGFVKTNNKLNYILQSNGGQGKARNRGILEAKGDYIAFLDADDLWVNNKLEVQVAELEKNKHIDLLFSAASAFCGSAQNFLKYLNHNNNEVYSGIEAFKTFIKGNKVPILTVLVKKEVLQAVGNFDESRPLQNVEDSHLWLKLLLANYKLKSSQEVLAFYRVHEGQSTNNKLKNTLKEINLLNAFKGKEAALDKALHTEIERKYFSLYIKNKSKAEKNMVLQHYSHNFTLRDKRVFKFLLNNTPLRLFSIYYRYVHTNLMARPKDSRI